MSVSLNSPPRSRKPRGQGATRRGEILAAATRIFLTDGIEGATMRRIAAAVGVSPTALYVYFPDKDAILQAIAEATFTKLLSVIETKQAGVSDTEARFRAGMRSYIDFGLANADAYRLTFMNAPHHPPCDDRSGIESAMNSFAILQNGVEDMMAAGLLRRGSSELVAEAICAAMHGITALLIAKGDYMRSPRETLINLTIDTIITGLR